MSTVENRVTQIVAKVLGVNKANIKPWHKFTTHLGADSLDAVELVMELEKEFCISIPDDKAEKIVTVGDAITYIQKVLIE